jgi:menaquinone-dependent protoporphyrinogen oxidase
VRHASRFLVLFATRHGHTRKVAEFIGECLSKRGLTVDLRDIATDPQPLLAEYGAAILVSPVHAGKHAKAIVTFAHRHRAQLEVLPSAFVSVNMTQATLDSATATDEIRRQALENLHEELGTFIDRSGWHPRHTLSAAGALSYTRYNWFLRWVMKRIARSQGNTTDTSRDHVYTDWAGVEAFVTAFATRFQEATRVDSPARTQ